MFTERPEGRVEKAPQYTDWIPIEKPNKAEKTFYGGRKIINQKNVVNNSYEYDTFDTHVDSVELDGGVEVGPKLGHPHFHVLLTLTHFTYLQFDYYTMKIFLGDNPAIAVRAREGEV